MEAARAGVAAPFAMTDYPITNADRRPMPECYDREDRHVGYAGDELRRPFAHYFRPRVGALQSQVSEAMQLGQREAARAYEVEEVASRLGAAGYEAMECGWARTEAGTLLVSCLTRMPRVRAEMWDWWFGWHGSDSARYKLWHPEAHLFCAWGDDRSGDASLSDRQRYVGNVSYVDEYVGETLNRIAIRFVEPALLGIEEAPGTTHICARVCSSEFPVAAGWIVHQVRPLAEGGGSEMRSRFFLGRPQVLDLPAHSVSKPVASRALGARGVRAALRPVVSLMARYQTRDQVGADLLEHCGAEMGHLAGFLPELYEEFRGTL